MALNGGVDGDRFFRAGVAFAKVLLFRIGFQNVLVIFASFIHVLLRSLEFAGGILRGYVRPLAEVALVGFARQIVGLRFLCKGDQIRAIRIVVGVRKRIHLLGLLF